MCALNYATATAVTLAARGGALLLGAITAVVLARGLGPEARGEYAIVTLLPLAIVTFANVGLGLATVRRVGRDPTGARVAATNVVVFTLVASIVSAAALWSLAAPIRRVYPAVSDAFLLIVILAVPQSLAYLLFQALLQATRAFVLSATLVILSYVFQFALLGILMLSGRLDLTTAIGAWFIAHLLIVVATAAAIARRTGFGRLDAASLLGDVRAGSVSWAGNLSVLFTTRAALFIAGAIADAGSVGLLAVAIVVAELIWSVPEAAAFSLAPFVAHFGDERSQTITPLITRSVLLLTALAAVAVGALAVPLVVLLFGKEFEDASVPLRWLLPGVVGYGLAKVLASDLLGRGRPDLALRASLAGAGTAVVLSALLVPTAGIVGGAAATTIAYLVTAAISVATFARTAGVDQRSVLVPTLTDVMLLVRRVRAAALRRPPEEREFP